MIHRNLFLLLFIFCVTMLMLPQSISAQKKMNFRDTSYILNYDNDWTVRTYLSKKYAPFELPSTTNFEDLSYKPNTKLNFGLGVTYKNFTANGAIGLGFLNKAYNNNGKGKTTGLNLDFHLFPKKLAIDLLGIFHKGYNLYPKGTAASNANTYYFRPDIKTVLLGGAGYVVANGDKFSYKASFIQNELQKKSAGSLLYGGEVNYLTFKGDSSIVPKAIQANHPEAGIKKVNVISFGPGIGYAYTLVFAKQFFITGSAIANALVNFTTEENSTTKNKKTSFDPGAIIKGAIGYNSKTWSIAATTSGNGIYFKGASSNKNYFMSSGNYRLTLSKKLYRKK